MNRKEHLTIEGLRKIVSLRASLNLGLSDDLNKAFPNTIPAPRPIIYLMSIPYPNWLACWFCRWEGCFVILSQKT